VNACNLCLAGAAPANPEYVTTFGDTCGELDNYLSLLSSEECLTDRIAAVSNFDWLCGCPNASPPTCAICPDGTSDISNSDRVIPSLNLGQGNVDPTCEQVRVLAALAESPFDGCPFVQKQAGFCGCSNVEPENVCSFCPAGGQPLRPDLVVSGDTCAELNEYVSFYDQAACDNPNLEGIQRFAFVCGCPDAEPICAFCPDGSPPEDLNSLAYDDGDQTTCGELAAFLYTIILADCDQTAESSGFSDAVGRCCPDIVDVVDPSSATTLLLRGVMGFAAVTVTALVL
jgi:hypothetical protein